MIRLSKPQILLLHEQLIAETGGSSGLRDEGMLDSALNAPFQTFDGEDVCPSLHEKSTLHHAKCSIIPLKKSIHLISRKPSASLNMPSDHL